MSFKAKIVMNRVGFLPLVVLCSGAWSIFSFQLPGALAGDQVRAMNIINDCKATSIGNPYDCMETALLKIVREEGIVAAMETLSAAGDRDNDIRRDGHEYAHAIGITGFQVESSVGTAFARCSEIFQSGCYHGVIQAYLFSVLDPGLVGDSGRINNICREFRGQSQGQWLLFQCVHALGHGLTSFYHHDLIRALQACDALEEGWDRHSCYGGAFMENVVHVTHPHHQTTRMHAADRQTGRDAVTQTSFVPVKANDPLYPCSILEERYLTDCYLMQTSIILYHNHGDLAAAARTCDGAPVGMRTWCYQSLGRDISAYTLQQPEESIRLCSLGHSDYQPWCYVGLVKNFIDVTAKAESGMNFCSRVPGSVNRMKCYEAIGEEIGALTAQETQREALCRQATGDLYEACRYGARLRSEPPLGIPIGF